MTTARKRTLICLATIIFALAFACGFSFAPPLVADALLPDSWNKAAAGNTGDWYLDGDNLDVDGVKDIVDGWRASAAYDFSSLADDPVVIAVIDSGVNSSHDIFGNGTCPDVFFRNASGEIIGTNTAGGTSFEDDASDRHGTHVAGIIAVLIHAFDLEDYIKIMPIKGGEAKSGGTSFSLSYVDKAIGFALENGADIINMSLTTPTNTTSAGGTQWNALFTDERADAALFVAAAGNDGKSSASYHFYPAESDNVVGVVNYMENSLGAKVLTSTSNYGADFDIAAPGYNILSADGDTTGSYKGLTGTSMASPVVAFAAALLEVEWRASLYEEVPDGVSEARSVQQVLSLHTEDTAFSSKDGKYYTALDLESLVGKSFVYSEAKGEMVLSEDLVDVAIVGSSDGMTLGRAGALSLGAELPEDAAAADYSFVWTVKFGEDGGVYYGKDRDITVSYTAEDVATMRDVTVRLELYLGMMLVGADELTLRPSYLAEGDFSLTADGGDTLPDTVESGTVFSLTDIQYVSPDFTAVWYVDGEEVAQGNEFTPTFKESGEHTLRVVVYNGSQVVYDYSVVLAFEADDSGASDGDFFGKIEQWFENNPDVYVIIGVVLGVAVVVAVAVVIALAVRHGGRRG